jgi:CubicO group peptidase (beta-lactamase class C family)
MKKFALPGLITLIILGYVFYLSLAKQLSYYSTHVACGNYYLSKRPLNSIIEKEANTKPFNVEWLDALFLKLLSYSVNEDNKTLSSSFGSVETTMKYYPNYGCSTDLNKNLSNTNIKISSLHPIAIDKNIQYLIDNEFVNDSGHRALIVMHQNNIVGQQFDQYTSNNTPLLSWSMTKSLTSLLFGRMMLEGFIELNDKVFPGSDDPKRNSLTYRHLLNHTDGLDYQEAYYPFTDFFKMFISANVGKHISNLDFKYQPGNHWAYSSAATNLLAYKLSEIGNALGFSMQELFQYFLFDELGIHDAVIGKDQNGNMIASSLGFISPTAWLSVGKLMKNNGSYNGKQIIDKDFISFMRSPVEINNGSKILNYGGQWWLNTKDPTLSPQLHTIDYEIYSANGFQGQRLMIIPALDLIIVRLGLTEGRTEWINEGPFISSLISNYAN